MKLNRRYKIKPLLFIIAILLIGSIGITYAYFKSQGSFVNEFNKINKPKVHPIGKIRFKDEIFKTGSPPFFIKI